MGHYYLVAAAIVFLKSRIVGGRERSSGCSTATESVRKRVTSSQNRERGGQKRGNEKSVEDQ